MTVSMVCRSSNVLVQKMQEKFTISLLCNSSTCAATHRLLSAEQEQDYPSREPEIICLFDGILILGFSEMVSDLWLYLILLSHCLFFLVINL